MKKFLFILCACLFGALSGVKAWNSVTPTVGRSYYLLNVGKQTFWYSGTGNSKRNYGHTSNLSQAIPVYIERFDNNTCALSYYLDGTKRYFYVNNDAEAQITSDYNTTYYWVGDGYYYLGRQKDTRRMRAEDAGTCNYPKNSGTDDIYRWQFISEYEVNSNTPNVCADEAEASYVTAANGWQRVTDNATLDASLSDYFFAIVCANYPDLMVNMADGNASQQAGGGYTSSKSMWYSNSANPEADNSFLWMIEKCNEGGYEGYTFRNASYPSLTIQAEGSASHYAHTHDQPNPCQWSSYALTPTDGVFTVKTLANGGDNYLGLWTPANDYINGQELAGNKGTAEQGKFLIYRKLKKNLNMTSRVTNPNFDSNKDGWTATGEFQNNQINNNKQGDFTGNFWENWDPSAKVNKMYQDLTNMPNGIYKVKIAAFVNRLAENNSSQYVFANNDKTYLNTTDPKFYEVWTAVTDNTLSIGLEQTTATTDWMGIDNVSLTYIDDLHDLTAVSGKMNADVNTAQQNAVNTYNSNKTAANYIAATEAIAAAEVSVAAYAKGKSALDKAGEILENTNVYTNEAYAAFAYEASLGKYNDGTWTNEEAENYNSTVFGTGWHTDANIANLLISAWDAPKTGDDRWGTYHINTWSNTADSGNPNMFVPCIEYWVSSENKLEDKVMTATIPGLNPGDKYSVTMYITVSKYNDAYSADEVTSPTGVSLQVGNGDVVNFSGTRINETRHFENTAFTAVGTVDASGNLIIKLNVSETNANWVYFRNVKYTYVGTPAVMVVNATAKWGTFCAPFAVEIPSGVAAYTCESAEGSKLTLVDVDETIPANTPVILNAEDGLVSTTFYGVKVPNATDDLIAGGLLVGNVSTSTKSVPSDGSAYLLQLHGDKVGFYKANGTGYLIGSNRCYLISESNVGNAAREAFFFFGDDATAISTLEAAKADAGAQKDGKYLENGKIVIVKNGVKYSANGQILK